MQDHVGQKNNKDNKKSYFKNVSNSQSISKCPFKALASLEEYFCYEKQTLSQDKLEFVILAKPWKTTTLRNLGLRLVKFKIRFNVW